MSVLTPNSPLRELELSQIITKYGLCNYSGVKNRTLMFNYDIKGIESVGKNKIEKKIEGQGQSSQKLIGSLTMPRCILYQMILTKVFCTSGPHLVILAWTGDKLWLQTYTHTQANRLFLGKNVLSSFNEQVLLHHPPPPPHQIILMLLTL